MNGDGHDTVVDYVDALLAEPQDTGAAHAPPPPAQVRVAAPSPVPASAATDPVAPAPPASPARPAVDGGGRWLRVAVGGDRYALALLRVQEVTRPAPVVPLRGAGAAMLGVMNLRGRVVPVLDLGLWLGSEAVAADEGNRIVVVERDDELIGLRVSAVQDVIGLGPADIEPPLAGTDPGAILGVARAGGGPPTVLFDAGALYASAPAQVGAATAVKAGEPSTRVLRP